MQAFFASPALASGYDISLGKSRGDNGHHIVVKEVMVCSRALLSLLDGTDTDD